VIIITLTKLNLKRLFWFHAIKRKTNLAEWLSAWNYELHGWYSKVLTASYDALSAKWRQHSFELKGCRNLSYGWNHQICLAAWVIFKVTHSFRWCSRRKMKATSVWAENLQKPLIRMRSTYLFSCMSDFQGYLQLQVSLWKQNEDNIRLSLKVTETSHTHEIITRAVSRARLIQNSHLGKPRAFFHARRGNTARAVHLFRYMRDFQRNI